MNKYTRVQRIINYVSDHLQIGNARTEVGAVPTDDARLLLVFFCFFYAKQNECRASVRWTLIKEFH